MRILWIAAGLVLVAASARSQPRAPASKQTQTRIAGVDVGKAFREFFRTKEAMKGFDKERREINADPRAEQLSKLADEVKQAEQAALRAAKIEEDARARALREAELKREEYRALDKALRESRNRRTADLNRRLVAVTRRLLAQVHKAAAEVGRERGYDFVVDVSGHTNTGMPLILYARDLPDLTNEVLARLNKDAPKSPESSEKPAAPSENDKKHG